jgi:hypothetical protein
MIVPLVVKSQQLRYGERTARGIAAGKRVCCALAYWTRESRRSSKRDMASPESAPDGEELQCGERLTTRRATGNFDDADSIEKDGERLNLRTLAARPSRVQSRFTRRTSDSKDPYGCFPKSAQSVRDISQLSLTMERALNTNSAVSNSPALIHRPIPRQDFFDPELLFIRSHEFIPFRHRTSSVGFTTDIFTVSAQVLCEGSPSQIHCTETTAPAISILEFTFCVNSHRSFLFAQLHL